MGAIGYDQRDALLGQRGRSIHGLDPNVDYMLKADYQGASSPWKTLSSFDSRKQPNINLKVEGKK